MNLTSELPQDSPSTLLLRFDSIRSTLTAVESSGDLPDPFKSLPIGSSFVERPREQGTKADQTGHIDVSPLRIRKKQKIGETMRGTRAKDLLHSESCGRLGGTYTPMTTLGYTFQGLSTSSTIVNDDAIQASSSRKASVANSELHLGLGSNIIDGGIAPGPSPPVTPTLSPLRRAFVTPRTAPSIPVTPSRAGSKAMQMLGAADLPRQGFQSGSPDYKGKKREFFRPLPSGIARELDAFWGTRAKPSKKLAPLRLSKDLPARPVSDLSRNIGQGATVTVVDGSGQVWHDLEEQAEFAWLLSEQGKGLALLSPIHLRGMPPPSPLASSPETDADHLTEHIADSDDGIKIRSSEDSDAEDECDPFGMPGPWQSVFNVQQQGKVSFAIGTKVSSFLGVAPGEAASKGLAFLSTDPYAPSKVSRIAPSKKRPPPLALDRATRLKPVNTVAVQQDFIDASFVASSQRAGISTDATSRQAGRLSFRGESQRKAAEGKGIQRKPAPRWESEHSFIDTSKQETLATSMSKKIGGMFRGN